MKGSEGSTHLGRPENKRMDVPSISYIIIFRLCPELCLLIDVSILTLLRSFGGIDGKKARLLLFNRIIITYYIREFFFTLFDIEELP